MSQPRTIEAAVEKIIKRPLTDADRQIIMSLRDDYGYDDSDPLAVVLAMLGAVTVLVEQVPGDLKKAATETIELHRATLRDQAMLVVKDLIFEMSKRIDEKSKFRWKDRLWGMAIGAATAAGICAIFLAIFFKFHG